MKIHWILFALLLAMSAVIALMLFMEEVPFEEIPDEAGDEAAVRKVYRGHGYTHERLPSMDQGGPGKARHEKILWPGLVFGILTLLFMTTLLVFGARRDEAPGPLAAPIAVGGILWAAIFAMLVLSYRGYMAEETHSLFLALPKPTAWFVYGFWPFQFFFMVIYIAAFRRLLVTDDDVARFQEILAAKKHRGEGGA